jgi:hypothetical protein
MFADMEKIQKLRPKIITAFQVIEHQSDPQAFLQKFECKEGDFLVLTSPGVDASSAKKMHSSGKWKSLSPSHHLCLYSEKGMAHLLENSGFRIISYEYVWSACHGAIDNFKKYLKKILYYILKKVLGRKADFPSFYWKNSFVVIAQKMKSHADC